MRELIVSDPKIMMGKPVVRGTRITVESSVCDVGVERQVVEALCSDAHEALLVAEMDPGISDDYVLNLAAQESAILVTSEEVSGVR